MLTMKYLKMFQLRSIIRTGVLVGGMMTVMSTFAATPSFGLVAQSNAVTFNQNDSQTDPIYADQISSNVASLTLFDTFSPPFVNKGYTFSSWNTIPDGSGTQYNDGASYNFALGNMALYAQWVPNHVTFFENASSTDSVSSIQNSSTLAPLTLFSDLSPNFSKVGYVFNGWSTSASGAGTAYSNGASYDFTLGSMSLYAQWTPATYAINYAADGGTASASSASFTTGGGSITLPTASQSGYAFDGWYTAAQGGSLVGTGGASFTPTSSMTLYAQWTASTSEVSFIGNGGVVSPATATYTTGSTPLTLPTPTQAGFTFDGWFTAPQGGSLVGSGGNSYVPTSSMALFAQWTAIPAFNVTFSANGGSGTVGSVSALSGAMVSLPSSASISRPGYVFTGWNSVADGSGLIFGPNSTFTLAGPMTLYAQWHQLPAATVTFALNGAHGAVAAISGYAGAIETLPSPPALIRPGYVFTGWNTRANGTGSMFAGGVTMILGTSQTLYAQWSGHAPAQLVSPIGPFVSANAAISGVLAAQVNHLAALVVHQRRSTVTLYGYASTASTAQAEVSEGRARAAAVAAALRRALAQAHHGGVRIVVVNEGLAAGASNRVSVVVR